MNEEEFKQKWEVEKPIYNEWGKYIARTIQELLISKEKNLDVFLKTPATCRLKEDSSLLDKAFYRRNKSYDDPYNEIEDKVGVRFIVLLLEDIEEISNIVKGCDIWNYDECKNFIEDRKRDPLLFTYQSVHFILRPRKNLKINDINIPEETACEVQIRTLLQHAHAELTHDAIYKAKKIVQPEVHRTVAKSMALIETTDDFFTAVTKELNYGPLQEYGVLQRLDGLYFTLTGFKSHNQKSSLVIWEEFEEIIDEKLIDSIQSFLKKSDYTHLPQIIKDRYSENILYQQSTVLFLYWMMVNKKRRLLADWPLSRELLQPLGVDLGVSTFDD